MQGSCQQWRANSVSSFIRVSANCPKSHQSARLLSRVATWKCLVVAVVPNAVAASRFVVATPQKQPPAYASARDWGLFPP
jgi:hypothetical protein